MWHLVANIGKNRCANCVQTCIVCKLCAKPEVRGDSVQKCANRGGGIPRPGRGQRLPDQSNASHGRVMAQGEPFPMDTGQLTQKAHHGPPCWRRKSAACTLAQSYRHRRPILMKGNSPFAFQLPSVRRLTGNRASNCFSSMKPVSPSGFGQISTFI